jgi:hypothetical protein
LAGDSNAKHPVRNSKVSNLPSLKLLELFVTSNFEISTPQCSTHYTPDGRGDVLGIIVRQNVLLSELIVTDILDSDHLPIKFSILDPVRTKEALDPVERLIDCELFQSLAPELVSSNIQIQSSNEADKAARDFAASIPSAYRISTRKTTIIHRKYEIPGLDHLLKHKRKLRKYGKKPGDPACKMAVNWVTRNIRRMAQKRHLKDGKQIWLTATSYFKQYGLLQNPSQQAVNQR